MPSSNFNGENLKVPPPQAYHYDLRLEIGVKNEKETVPVVAIFRDLARRMREVADGGNNLVVLTATDKMYFDQKEMTSEEFQKAFQVDKIEGKTTKVLLGFKIRTMTKLSELKTRLMQTYLKPHNLFLREHKGGFENGVKIYAYGYLKYDHPDHFDLPALNQRFARRVTEAWRAMDKDERKKWKMELPDIFFGSTGIMLPMIFTKEKVTATLEDKDKISTYALVVSTHAKYGKLAKVLLDAALCNKKINNLIPFALNRENQAGFYYLTAEQARFMENHRNIPITNVPIDATSRPGNKDKILQELLLLNPSIQRVAFDSSQNKLHISTMASKYREVYDWIDRLLKDHQFPYGPQLRPLKYGASPSYGDIFKDAVSVATGSYVSIPNDTTKRNPWKQRPPLDISYVPTDEAFPPLPTKKTSQEATASTASETLDEETIHSAISAAIRKLEDQHKAEMEKMRTEFQMKLEKVENQMKELGTQVATQTYQALVKEESPLATKADQENIRQDITIIKTQLNAILKFFAQDKSSHHETPAAMNQTAVTHTPPPVFDTHAKKSKVYTTPVKMRPLGDLYTQDDSVTSATSSPVEDMEGCEY